MGFRGCLTFGLTLLLFESIQINAFIGLTPRPYGLLNHGPPMLSKRRVVLSMRVDIQRDVLVIGGGLAGLSVAYELASKHGRQVTVLSRDAEEAAARAAAGMLAPQAERLPAGPYLDLCLRARAAYPAFAAELEAAAAAAGAGGGGGGGGGGEAGVGYLACGFVAPVFPDDPAEGRAWAPPPGSGRAEWVDAEGLRALEPGVSPEAVGGWWYPEDAQVDARRLHAALARACAAAGVEVLEGPGAAAAALVLAGGGSGGGGGGDESGGGGGVARVRLADGRAVAARAVVVAAGAWLRDLLPVPVAPQKGQMLALRAPPGQLTSMAGAAGGLRRVVYSERAYIVPKAGGRVVVGATVEPDDFSRHVTARGLHQLLEGAMATVPALADYAVEETWAGLRPLTPDTHPVLGPTAWRGLHVCGGYWRNGVLLTPEGARLVAAAVAAPEQLGPEDRRALEAFRWDRFHRPSSSSAAAVGGPPAAAPAGGGLLGEEEEGVPGWLELVRPERPGGGVSGGGGGGAPAVAASTVQASSLANTVSEARAVVEDFDVSAETGARGWFDLVRPESPAAGAPDAGRSPPAAAFSEEEEEALAAPSGADWLRLVAPERPAGAGAAAARRGPGPPSPSFLSGPSCVGEEEEEEGEEEEEEEEAARGGGAGRRASGLLPGALEAAAEAEKAGQGAFGFVEEVSNDAYDDIMQYRAEAEKIEPGNRAANRGPYTGAYSNWPDAAPTGGGQAVASELEDDVLGEEMDVTAEEPDWLSMVAPEQPGRAASSQGAASFAPAAAPLERPGGGGQKKMSSLLPGALEAAAEAEKAGQGAFGFVEEVSNDAYEDIMQYRAEAEKIGPGNRAANRGPYTGAYSNWPDAAPTGGGQAVASELEDDVLGEEMDVTAEEPDWLSMVAPEQPGRAASQGATSFAPAAAPLERPGGGGQKKMSSLLPGALEAAAEAEKAGQGAFGFVEEVSNDAYDDIMQYRAEAEKIGPGNRAANRGPYTGAYSNWPDVAPTGGQAVASELEDDVLGEEMDVTAEEPDWLSMVAPEQPGRAASQGATSFAPAAAPLERPGGGGQKKMSSLLPGALEAAAEAEKAGQGAFGFVEEVSNDAYDDIMQYRAEAEKIGPGNRAANRGPYTGAYSNWPDAAPTGGGQAVASELEGAGVWEELDVAAEESSWLSLVAPEHPAVQQAALRNGAEVGFGTSSGRQGDGLGDAVVTSSDDELDFEEGWWNELEVVKVDQQGNANAVSYKGPGDASTKAQATSSLRFFNKPVADSPPGPAAAAGATPPTATAAVAAEEEEGEREEGEELGFEEGWWEEVAVARLPPGGGGAPEPVPYRGPRGGGGGAAGGAAPARLQFFNDRTAAAAPAAPAAGVAASPPLPPPPGATVDWAAAGQRGPAAAPPAGTGGGPGGGGEEGEEPLGFEEGWWREVEVLKVGADGAPQEEIQYRGPSLQGAQENPTSSLLHFSKEAEEETMVANPERSPLNKLYDRLTGLSESKQRSNMPFSSSGRKTVTGTRRPPSSDVQSLYDKIQQNKQRASLKNDDTRPLPPPPSKRIPPSSLHQHNTLFGGGGNNHRSQQGGVGYRSSTGATTPARRLFRWLSGGPFLVLLVLFRSVCALSNGGTMQC